MSQSSSLDESNVICLETFEQLSITTTTCCTIPIDDACLDSWQYRIFAVKRQSLWRKTNKKYWKSVRVKKTRRFLQGPRDDSSCIFPTNNNDATWEKNIWRAFPHCNPLNDGEWCLRKYEKLVAGHSHDEQTSEWMFHWCWLITVSSIGI